MAIELENVLPSEIEKRSFEIITEELTQSGIVLNPEKAPVIKRCIHTSADFDYAQNLVFSENAIARAKEAIRNGASIVTDTQMGRSGINKKSLAQYGGQVYCFMSDEDVAELAKKNGTTRATASMDKAASLDKKLIFAIGNAPTALVRLYELIEEGKLSRADHRRSGRVCKCGAVKRADYGGRRSLYCGKRKKRRQQHCSLHLQRAALHDRQQKRLIPAERI